MSVLDEVRSVPGGAELAGLAERLIGDPGAVAAAAGAWRAAASTARQHTGALATAAGDVRTAWQGGSAEAFAGYMSTLTRAGDRVAQALEEAAGHLDSAAETLRTAESQALEVCQGYASAVRELRAATPPPTEEQLTRSAAPALNEARGILQRLVTETGSTLSSLAGKITTATAGIPDVAATVPEPDAQPFAPRAGQPLGWSPASRGDGGGTSLAGHGTGAGGHGGTTGGFGGYGPSGPPPPGGGPAPQGQVAGWINQAVEILKAHGYPADKMHPNDIYMIIKHESGGNPHAINNWDSNAAKGTPSKGLMQTIDPTFQRHKLPGHDDIYNPVDNIIAGVRYAIDRYGSVSNVPGVVGMKTGTGYRGY
ncbi:transglycosylase SLT domain-containing protein [Nonomuraea sp. NPDC049421]|uniref:transglycosylase SLT domain-containing protein n=1 Tax=Nonomuraea sp. NPDC049421 TaxID=3155275 RepID=UPI00342B85A5